MIVYYSDKQVAEMLSVSRDTIWRWAREKDFPQPYKISERCTRWRSDEIENWIASRANN
jgi:prophage regulatory protein